MYCNNCKKEIPQSSNFCPLCGKPQESKPLTLGGKIKIYIVSVIFAPMGLIWFFKYFRSPEKDKRVVAYASLVITIAVIAFTTITLVGYLNSMQGYIKTAISPYTELGY